MTRRFDAQCSDVPTDESMVEEGAATGAIGGGVLGTAAVGLIPGIGPVIAAGALAAIAADVTDERRP